ncbi:MAG: hypothetical protein KDC33_06150, partial [Thermoleophilia bacterium]|nr:hypothetical protein [Thermoleophilia bacterium]
HFGPVRADGATREAAFTAGCLDVAAGGVLALGWAVSARRADRHRRRAVAATGGLASSLAATMYVLLAGSQVGLERWQDARLGLWTWPVTLAVPFAYAALAGRMAVRGVPLGAAVARGRDDGMTLRPGQRAVWTSGAHARGMLAFGTGLVIAGIGAAVVARPALAVPLCVAGVALVELGVIRVRVDDRGLVVRYGPLGFPSTRIRLGRIASAEVTDVSPLRNGGWGYRGSLRLIGRAAVVLRRGPGIAATLRDGGRFVVTVDDAATGAALLDAEAQRAAASGG